MNYDQAHLDDLSLSLLLEEALLWLRMLESDPPEDWAQLLPGYRIDIDAICVRLADPNADSSETERDERTSLWNFCAFLRRHHDYRSAAEVFETQGYAHGQG